MMGEQPEIKSLPFPQRIWAMQSLWLQIAKAWPDILTDILSGMIGKVAVIVMSTFMIAYPVVEIASAWNQGTLLLSVPLFGMVLVGVLGVRLGLDWERLSRD